jgi:ferrous iron transport protein A
MGVLTAVLALRSLPHGRAAEVVGVDRNAAADVLADRLHELGFFEGEQVRVLNRGIAGGPIAVRVGSTTFALRGVEAERIRVKLATA